MSNYATTTYKVTGPREQVKELATALQTLEPKYSNSYIELSEVAEYFLIDAEECGIDLNGDIFGIEYEEGDDNNSCLLTFTAESKYEPCNDLLYEIDSKLGGELNFSYRWYIAEDELFYVNDEGGFFPEECCVHSEGGPFGEEREWEPVATVREAIDEWGSKTGIEQGDRTDDEMIDFINSYDEYETDDEDDRVYYNIYRFIPE